MRRRLDQLLPVLVLLGFLATAVVINLMLSNAEERGVEALEDSSLAEVQAISRSQNQRFDSQLSGIGSFLDQENPPYELTVGSRSDLGKLNKLLELVERNPDFRTGFYVLDLDGTVTQGVRLLDDTSLGKAFEWPGYEELTARQEFALSLKGGILPVSKGLTTNEPVIATVVPIGTQGTPRRGAFVFESTVADSDFNEEINKLSRGETGEYLVYDQMGSVVASNDPGLLGNQLGEITAPAAGVVLFLVTSPAIKADGLLMGIGVPE